MRASLGALAALVVLALMGVSFAAGLIAGTPRATPAPTPLRPTPTATPQPATPSPSPSPSPSPEPGVAASAVVVPQRSVDLAAQITAEVEAVFVGEHDRVREGQLLLRLDTSARRAAVDLAEADLTRARAAAERAQVVLDNLPDDAGQGQRDQALADLRLAEAEIGLAESALEAARAALRQTDVRAPFAGTVATLRTSVGEQAIAGQPLVTVADMSGWLFETVDLSELDVVRVAVGDRATINVAALPDLQLEGVVEQIRVRGEAADGGVRFEVIVRPLEHVVTLRWNMTATIHILSGN